MSESKELTRIKNKYGEKFMHLCRELFPTILEEEGKLLKILESSFAGNSRTLGEDITEDIKEKFKSYILSKVEPEKKEKIDIGDKTPYELLAEAGYDLYECKSEDDIQKFRKYYKTGEELCTFGGGRLNRCVVFWAVKKDAEKINRKDFENPQREDEYGTSVMSIQFSRHGECIVSIKNRYNHTVNNPDATYGNDLDRIIPGLTQSFEKLLSERGMKLNSSNKEKFEIPGYTVANDGRYYKYNMETNQIYYCPGNVIINHGNVEELEPEKEELIDYFILNKKEKTLKLYDSRLKDCFGDSFKDINKIKIIKNPDKEKQTRIISILTKESEIPIKIEIDKDNNIVGYENQELKEVDNYFLFGNQKLKQLSLPKLEEVGNAFLYNNKKLSKVNLPQLKKVGDNFLYNNVILSQLELPQLEEVGQSFMYWNNKLEQLSLPELKEVGKCFLLFNEFIGIVYLPQLEKVGNSFLSCNKNLIKLSLPHLKIAGKNFIAGNEKLTQVNLPKIEEICDNFLVNNSELKILSLPSLNKVGDFFLATNEKLIQLSIPNLKLEASCCSFLDENPNRKQLIANMKKKINIGKDEISKLDIESNLITTEVGFIRRILNKIHNYIGRL